MPKVTHALDDPTCLVSEDRFLSTREMNHIGDVAREFVRQKSNIYFSKDVLAQDLLARDERAVEHLSNYLKRPPSLENLPIRGDVEWPSAIAERMAALDLLERLAALDSASGFGEQVSDDARDELRRLCELEIPKTTSMEDRKVMVAEKYDAFVAMAHVDSYKAFAAYRTLSNDAQREVMAPALMTALVEQGIPRANVDAEFLRRVQQL